MENTLLRFYIDNRKHLPGIAFIVAAYIIHYGVHLQDEVDHTL